MVSKQTNRRKTIGRFVLILCLVLVVAFFALGVWYVLKKDWPLDNGIEEDSSIDEGVFVPEPEPEEKKIIPINFQPEIDNWVTSIGGEKGIIVYDLDLGTYVGSYNAEKKFDTASIYKLFVVYEGYRRVQSGEWDRDEVINWTGHTTLECLDLAIRESNSPCAETLWSMIGRDELNAIVQSAFDLPDMFVNSLEATPTEVAKMVEIYFNHADVIDTDLVLKMKDSFLNQPATTYDWRQGLPSGFSERALVYNKVGWNYDGNQWSIYDDAAIVEFPEQDRRFIVVVMTNGVNFRQIRNLATMLEEKFFSMY